MKRYYANLLGNWTDITDAGTVCGGQKPFEFFEDNPGYLSGKPEEGEEWKKDALLSVEINDKEYHIHPSCFQVVVEKH